MVYFVEKSKIDLEISTKISKGFLNELGILILK